MGKPVTKQGQVLLRNKRRPGRPPDLVRKAHTHADEKALAEADSRSAIQDALDDFFEDFDDVSG